MKRYRMLIEESRDAIGIVNENGVLIDANQALLDLFGYERKDIVGFNVTQLYVDPSERQLFLEYVSKNKNLRDYELRLRKKDGTEIICLVTPRIRTVSNHGLVSYMAILHDFTEQKRAQECLAQRQRALEAVYEMATSSGSSFENVCRQVAKNICQLLNVWCAIILCNEDDGFRVMAVTINNESLHEIEPPRQSFHNPLSTFLEDSSYARNLCELLDEKKYNKEFTLESCLQIPIKNRAGSLFGAIVIMDRSERAFTDMDLHLVEILSRYIEQEIERNFMIDQLRRSDEMKMLGQLVVGVAHEVRNPLNAVLAITEALAQDLGQYPQYNAHLDHIKIQVNRLSRLMFDLLNFGRPVNASSLQRQPLVSIISSAVELWKQSRLRRPSPTVVVRHPQGNDIKILADGAKIQQALLNLLNNAEEASPTESEVIITVSVLKDRMVRVSVADEGCGIKSASLPHIFDPFVTCKKGGIGLGLSIVKNIVEAHGGKVNARNNEPPPGCIVEFVLPIHGDQS